MSQISTFNPITDYGSPTVTPNKFSDLTSEEFVRIMFTELSNQDPLKPNDSNALLQQMSSLRSIESDVNLSKKLESVVTQNQLATAGALLGKTIYGLTADNLGVTGVVKSVSSTINGPVLTLASGERIAFGDIVRMEDTVASAPTTPTTPTTPTSPTTPTPATPTDSVTDSINPNINLPTGPVTSIPSDDLPADNP